MKRKWESIKDKNSIKSKSCEPANKKAKKSTKKTRSKKNQEVNGFRTLNIKCSLAKILRPDIKPQVQELINDYVYRVSNMAYEAAKLIQLFIIWWLQNKPGEPMVDIDQTFIDNAFILVSSVEEKRSKVREAKNIHIDDLKFVFEKHYKSCRSDEMSKIHRDNLTPIRGSASRQLLTAARNQVMMNFRKRSIEWIKLKLRLKGAKLTRKQTYKISELIYRMSTTCSKSDSRKIRDIVLNFEDEDKEDFIENYSSVEIINWAFEFSKENIEFFKKYKMEIPYPDNLGHKKKWFKYIPWLYRILTDFKNLHELYAKSPDKKNTISLKGKKLFTLFPSHKMRPLHILLDNSTIKRMSKKLDKFYIDADSDDETMSYNKREYKNSHKKNNDHKYWAKMFNFDKFPKSGNSSQFAYSIRTDGSSASIMFLKKNMKHHVKNPLAEHDDDMECKEEINQRKIDIDPNQRIVAVDPGRRDLFYAVDNQGNTIRCSNGKYRDLAGFNIRKMKQNKWFTDEDGKEIKEISEKMNSAKCTTVDEFKVHLKYVLAHLRRVTAFYCQKRYKKLKLSTYIRRQRTIDELCLELTGGDRNTIIAYGDAGFSSSSKGQASTPNKGFKNRLHMHCDNIIKIDEFRTSKACHNCKDEGYIETKTPSMKEYTTNNLRESKDENPWKKRKKVRIRVKKGSTEEELKLLGYGGSELSRIYGLRICPNCRKTFNRDWNAAENIMEVFLYQNKKSNLTFARPPYLSYPKSKIDTTLAKL